MIPVPQKPAINHPKHIIPVKITMITIIAITGMIPGMTNGCIRENMRMTGIPMMSIQITTRHGMIILENNLKWLKQSSN